MTDGINPFGEPDGSRAPIGLTDHSFVAFENPTAWGGLATKPHDLSARILIGRKGSGKTVYLRRLRDAAAQNNDLYASREEQTPPDSLQVIQFAYRTRGQKPSELWELAWSRAIMRAAVNHLLAVPSLRDQLSEPLLLRLETGYESLLETRRPGEAPSGVFSQMKALLSRDRSPRELLAYLHHEQWSRLKEDTGAALRECRPICFFLDAVDEYYEAAPRPWLECQTGLFFALMATLRDDRFGNRLHVFAALRDAVMLRVEQSEHGLRHLHERYVRVLEWDAKSIMVLLNHKIEGLDKSLLRKAEASSRVEAWLGRTEQVVKSRNATEPITAYLLRHTRLLPRDVIIQGNLICTEMAREHWFPDLTPEHDPVRDAVRIASARFGNELITRCVNHIVAEMMPDDAIKHGFESVYLDRAAGIHADVRSKLCEFIRQDLKYDRMSSQRLKPLAARGHQLFGDGVDILDALWLTGIMGYTERPQAPCAVFHSSRHASGLSVPLQKPTYVVHSCLIDAVALKPKGTAICQCA